MKNKGPDRVNIRKSDREIYDNLKEKDTSPFQGQENRILYMNALAIGYTDGERIEFEAGEKEGFILLSTLQDEDKAIIKAVAVAERENLNVLVDNEEVIRIADEYAAGGIQLLNDNVFGQEYGSYIKRVEGILTERFQSLYPDTK